VTRGSGEVVEEHHLASAIALYDWLREETERVYMIMEMGEEEAERITLLDKVRSLGGSITPNKLWASNRKKWVDSDRARKALLKLAGYSADGVPLPDFALAPLVRGKRDRFYVRGSAPAADDDGVQAKPADALLSDSDWIEFVKAHRQQFPLLNGQDGSFIHGWRKRLAPFTLAELLVAIEDLAADPRRVTVKSWPGLYATNHCPFLAESVQRRRFEQRNQERVQEQAQPPEPSVYDDPLFSRVEFAGFYTRARKVDPSVTIEAAREQYLAEKRSASDANGVPSGI
jgi:hypothetical protein